jgi:hypothetical protein
MSVYHQVTVMQGDDPSTANVEPRTQILVIDRTYWYIPWNSSEIYTYVPPGARNVSFDHVQPYSHQGSTIYIPGAFSYANNMASPPSIGPKEGEGFEGYHFWRFAQDAQRDLVNSLNFTSTLDFADADPEFTVMDDWNFTNGTLRLETNISSSTYVSKVYTGGVDLINVNATYLVSDEENATMEITVDNGTTWREPEHGVNLEFDDEGTEFRWRVTMTQNVSLNNTPELEWAAFDSLFTPRFNELLMETTYIMEVDGKELEFDQVFPFDLNTTTFVMIFYMDEDMTLEVTGTEVIKTPSTMIPGKVTYTHMTGGHDSIITFHVTDLKATQEEGTDTTFWMFVVVGVLILLMCIGLAMVLLSDRGGKEAPAGGPVESSAEGNDDLLTRKAELMEAIKDLDEDREIGLISEEEHMARREELKADTMDLMRAIEEQEEN